MRHPALLKLESRETRQKGFKREGGALKYFLRILISAILTYQDQVEQSRTTIETDLPDSFLCISSCQIQTPVAAGSPFLQPSSLLARRLRADTSCRHCCCCVDNAAADAGRAAGLQHGGQHHRLVRGRNTTLHLRTRSPARPGNSHDHLSPAAGTWALARSSLSTRPTAAAATASARWAMTISWLHRTPKMLCTFGPGTRCAGQRCSVPWQQ